MEPIQCKHNHYYIKKRKYKEYSCSYISNQLPHLTDLGHHVLTVSLTAKELGRVEKSVYINVSRSLQGRLKVYM